MRIIGDIEINKTTIWVAVILFFFVVVVVFSISLYRSLLNDEWKLYREARRKHSIEAYQTYLALYPEGRFVRYAHDDMEGLYAEAYRNFFSFMSDQAQQCRRIAQGYIMAGVHARARRDDNSAVEDDYQRDLEIDGTLKSLSEANKVMDRFLQYGAFKGSRYADVHAAGVEVFHAYLKIYQLAVNPEAAERDYSDALDMAQEAFFALKKDAVLMLSRVSADIVRARAQAPPESEDQ